MKRILFIVLFTAILLGCIFGQTPAGVDTVYYVNTGESVSFVWENDETDPNGIPYPAGSIVTYDVFLYQYNLVTWPATQELIDGITQNTLNLISIGSTSEKEIEIDFMALLDNVYYFAGVREVVDIEGLGTDIIYSDIAWSFSSVATNPILPFAYLKHTGVWILTLPFGLQAVITQ